MRAIKNDLLATGLTQNRQECCENQECQIGNKPRDCQQIYTRGKFKNNDDNHHSRESSLQNATEKQSRSDHII